MSEEEKEAIEILKEFKETGFHTLRYKYNKDRLDCNVMIENTIETILNLIEKQQKEINELKEINADLVKTRIEDFKELNRIQQEDFISKDKIEDKIKDLEKEKDLYFEKQIIQGKIDFLKDLLEE